MGLAGPGLAQDSDETKAKKPVLLGTITLFADRLGRALSDVQGHISVVGGEELTKRNVQTLEGWRLSTPRIFWPAATAAVR